VSTRIAALLVSVVVSAALPAALASCGAGAADAPPAASPSPSASGIPGGASTGGMKIAPGLYDLAGGTVQAVGTVEYRDLEGGFWAVVGGTAAEGDVGKVVAIIANGADYAQQLKDLEGLAVIVNGTMREGPSTRMAGPEIAATKIVAASDAPPGPAE
jgi:hypothetical protein